MNYLAVILGLMIAAQPVQGAPCDMDSGGNPDPHAGMVHHSDASPSGHDCCQSSDSEGSQDCSDMTQCGPCATAIPAVPPLLLTFPPAIGDSRCWLEDGALTPSHGAPPFRPPKSIS